MTNIAVANDAVVRLVSLSKQFGSISALDSVTCHVGPGEVVGLLGLNGAGKTTTLKVLLGMLIPSSGSATVSGMDCARQAQAVKRRVGYCSDEPSFYDYLTGRETIEFVLQVRGMWNPEARRRANDVIDALDFARSLDDVVGRYSLAAKKKLALVLAFAHSPCLLLLDEPTNGLDPPATVGFRAILQKHAEAGATVIISTHILTLAEQLCERFLVLDRGRLLADASLLALRQRTSAQVDASLEDVFLRLVTKRAET